MKAAYLIVLFVSLLAVLKFPDTDLILIFILDHRSIITHGIIVPYFLYKYLTKKVKSEFLDYAYIGFLIGIAIHLCADLFPKAYIGYAMIKLPFFISIGAPLSIAWMLGNMFFALLIAFKKLKDKNLGDNLKKLNFLAFMVIGIVYLIIDTNFVSKIILMVISFPIIWIYAKRGYKFIKKYWMLDTNLRWAKWCIKY